MVSLLNEQIFSGQTDLGTMYVHYTSVWYLVTYGAQELLFVTFRHAENYCLKIFKLNYAGKLFIIKLG